MKNKTIGGNMAASPKPTISSSIVTQPNSAANAAQPQNPSHGSDPGKDPSNGSLPRHILDQIIAQVARAPEAPVAEPLVTKTDLAKHFRVSERTVQRWIGNDMPFVWVGRVQKRFRLSQVQLWLQQNRIDRFAAQGIATTMAEVRRRIVNIPILNGLEIVDSAKPSSPRPVPAGASASAEDRAKLGKGEGQTSESSPSRPSFTPRCRPGRKPKNKPPTGKSCHGNGHTRHHRSRKDHLQTC